MGGVVVVITIGRINGNKLEEGPSFYVLLSTIA